MIQQTDLKRFRELLDGEYKKDGRIFKTDEIRIENGKISIWDKGRKDWYYLTEDLEWTGDAENEGLITII